MEVGTLPQDGQADRPAESLGREAMRRAWRLAAPSFTTSKSVTDWPGMFAGDEALTAAILDRLLHKSVVLNIRGRSSRLPDIEKLLK
jgi:hypothetical protein